MIRYAQQDSNLQSSRYYHPSSGRLKSDELHIAIAPTYLICLNRITSGDGMRGYRNSLRIDTIVAPQSLRIALLTVEATTITATSRYPFDHTGTAEMPCDDWGAASHSNLGSDALLFPYCKADMGDRCLTCGCIVHLPEGGSGKSRA